MYLGKREGTPVAKVIAVAVAVAVASDCLTPPPKHTHKAEPLVPNTSIETWKGSLAVDVDRVTDFAEPAWRHLGPVRQRVREYWVINEEQHLLHPFGA